MHIICPHCTTSYAIDLATLGVAGRTVRCSRCKEVWLARPEDATEVAAPIPAMAAADDQTGNTDAAAEWDALAREDDAQQQTPVPHVPPNLLYANGSYGFLFKKGMEKKCKSAAIGGPRRA